MFCSSHPETWIDHIPMAESIHNHRPHSSTGKSLFYLMLGYEPQAIPNIIKNSYLPEVEECLKTLERARNEALAAIKLTQQLITNWFKTWFTPFKVNDKVWLEARNLK